MLFRSERAVSLVLSVDCSGSMTQPILQAVAGELKAVAGQAESVTIIVSDTRIHQVVENNDVEAFLQHLRFRGGGGTDHRPVFDWLRERHRSPDLFVGLTDLCSRFPAKPPGFPVLWVVPEKHGSAPWGRTVVMNAT